MIYAAKLSNRMRTILRTFKFMYVRVLAKSAVLPWKQGKYDQFLGAQVMLKGTIKHKKAKI